MSELKQKLFRATRYVEPDWGKATIEWIQYFTAASKETVEAVLRDRYGKLTKYYRMDESTDRIDIVELEVEVL